MATKTEVVSQQPQVQYVQPGHGGYQTTVGADGNAVNWMPPAVQAPVGCPPGLEYLTSLDQLIIKQQIELFEAFTGFETNNRYRVLNSVGQDVYFAAEENDCCTRNSCGPIRPFEMTVLDNFQREIIRFVRPLKCQGCCCWCCLQELEVHASGAIIGYVIQKWSLWDQKLEILDAERRPILKINGPCCVIPCCVDVKFQINSLDESVQVGEIIRQYVGCGQECFTDASTFSLTFPPDLDVKVKATIFGAAMLLDFMFFEHNSNS